MVWELGIQNSDNTALYLYELSDVSSYVVFEAIALPRDTSRQFFLLPRSRLGLELSASCGRASPRPRRLFLKFASK